MATTPYEVRAYRFAQSLCRVFEGCRTLSDFEWKINLYNRTHSIPIRYDHGVSRIAVMRADYVVKFELVPDEEWDDGNGGCRAGNNSSEEEVYNRAVEAGFAYLLAKTTVVTIAGRTISIMPRIDHVGDCSRNYWDFLTDAEYDWLKDNIHDIHAWNVGYKCGKPVVIDYGWDSMM